MTTLYALFRTDGDGFTYSVDNLQGVYETEELATEAILPHLITPEDEYDWWIKPIELNKAIYGD